MKLLNSEDIIISSNDDKIVLSNYRVSMTDRVWGKSYKISIFLEDISSIETHFKSNVVWLILAVFFGISGVIMSINEGSGIAISLIIPVILIFVWVLSRTHIVKISSKGGNAIKFIVEKMSADKIEDFVIEVQNAKLKRIDQISIVNA